MARLIVIGGINMDVHLFGAEAPKPGRPLLVDHYLTEPGGKGANVAQAAARLGAKVCLVGRVGDDGFGRACVASCVDDGVDVSGVLSDSTRPTVRLSVHVLFRQPPVAVSVWRGCGFRDERFVSRLWRRRSLRG
jgi:sugar/nucleoside kinase (ribokinase family)